MSADASGYFGPELREVLDGDSWALIALISACWTEYPGCVIDVEGEYPELLAPAGYYRARGGHLWVVPDGNWIGACVGICPGLETSVELVKLYVARHLRGRGWGTALVEIAEHRARQLGADGIELWSDTRFLDAHRLYLRLGYERTGVTRQLHDLSHTVEYRFHKSLSLD